MKILIGCEESQTLTRMLRRAGHEAWSCDIQPTRGNPGWHVQCDIHDLLVPNRWDMIILHPECTALAVSGNRWYGEGMPRHFMRQRAIEWTVDLWRRACAVCNHVALENPVSVIFQHLNAPVCYTQPYNHGHGEQKKTGFALHNLPPLKPTNPVPGRRQSCWKMGPSPTRSRDRSKTYPGIAKAITLQWANAIQAQD